jgi:hypothetical protein
MDKMSIRGLVSIGGDGSLSIAQQLFEGGELKTVPPDGGLGRTARALGICLGD